MGESVVVICSCQSLSRIYRYNMTEFAHFDLIKVCMIHFPATSNDKHSIWSHIQKVRLFQTKLHNWFVFFTSRIFYQLGTFGSNSINDKTM